MSRSLTSFIDDAPIPARSSEDKEPVNVQQQDFAGCLAEDESWKASLREAIEREVLPKLLAARQTSPRLQEMPLPQGGEVIANFVQLIIEDDVDQLRALADRVILHTGGRDALLNDLLKPAAQYLGEMWERDACDFITVTLGVYRLNQILRETAGTGVDWLDAQGFESRVLLVPAPGDQHSFGAAMVADAFREGGWCVRAAPGATRGQLLRLVADEWFDVVGLSVSSERFLKGLPSCIRAIRAASCNPNVFIMLGGGAIMKNAERTRFLSADSTAGDGAEALLQANLFMGNMVTRRLCQSKTNLIDVSRAL